MVRIAIEILSILALSISSIDISLIRLWIYMQRSMIGMLLSCNVNKRKLKELCIILDAFSASPFLIGLGLRGLGWRSGRSDRHYSSLPSFAPFCSRKLVLYRFAFCYSYKLSSLSWVRFTNGSLCSWLRSPLDLGYLQSPFDSRENPSSLRLTLETVISCVYLKILSDLCLHLVWPVFT